MIALVALGSVGSVMKAAQNSDGVSVSDSASAVTSAVSSSTSQQLSVSDTSISSETTTAVSISEAAETTISAEHRKGDEFVGISDKDIGVVSSYKQNSVNNDKTGRWKCVTVSQEDFSVPEYALSCYHNYFDSDDTILAVENLTTKISARISYGSGLLFVSEYEYVDGEEHDAILMFSGKHLNEYLVYVDNGDIERVAVE